MKLFLHIIVGTTIILSGLSSAFGFSLFDGGQTSTVNRWPYSFGDRYIYDNTGSKWNYDSRNRFHQSPRHDKYCQPRFEYNYKVEGHSEEEFQDLVEHLSKDNI